LGKYLGITATPKSFILAFLMKCVFDYLSWDIPSVHNCFNLIVFHEHTDTSIPWEKWKSTHSQVD